MSPKAAEDGESLKRLGGGNWQTRDGRFTIESASGTWSLVDAEQTDELGLPLVRGPFRSLTDAKEAIEAARTSRPPASELKDRSAELRTHEKPDDEGTAAIAGRTKTAKPAKGSAPRDEPGEPRWMAELEASDRRRAHRLIARLEERGVRDPEGAVRRDLAGEVPEVPRIALADRIVDALDDTDPATTKLAAKLVDILAEGRDEHLDVRWRLVDEEGRAIRIGPQDLAAARKRRSARD